METNIRVAKDHDIEHILAFSRKLCDFNRANHDARCTYDDYSLVAEAVTQKMRETFQNRDKNTLFLIAETGETPIGYVFARIYEEAPTNDNGTGKVGLLDELFLDEQARGLGLGQCLMDEVMEWFKSNDIRRVKLHAYSWNIGAKAVYEKNGFKEYAVSYEKFI